MSEQSHLFVGMDAGGTKTRVVYSTTRESAPLVLEGPGINLKRDGLQKSAATCLALIGEVMAQLAVALDAAYRPVLCAGIAGAGRKGDRKAFQSMLAAGLPPGSTIYLLTDAEIAYFAAHGEESGILIVTGTGSIILAKTAEGEFDRAGGWGYLLGDEAGGYQLGRQALAAVAHAMDGGPATLLQQLLAERFDVTSPDALVAHTYAPDTVIQHHAPLLLEAAAADDAVAIQILDDQFEALANQLAWLLGLHPDITLRLAHVGGLRNNAFYRKRLQSTLSSRFPGLSFHDAAITPADAALHIAQHGIAPNDPLQPALRSDT